MYVRTGYRGRCRGLITTKISLAWTGRGRGRDLLWPWIKLRDRTREAELYHIPAEALRRTQRPYWTPSRTVKFSPIRRSTPLDTGILFSRTSPNKKPLYRSEVFARAARDNCFLERSRATVNTGKSEDAGSNSERYFVYKEILADETRKMIRHFGLPLGVLVLLLVLGLLLSLSSAAALGVAPPPLNPPCSLQETIPPTRRRIPISRCRPVLSLSVRNCNKLIRQCRCQHNIPMKMAGSACPGTRGNGVSDDQRCNHDHDIDSGHLCSATN